MFHFLFLNQDDESLNWRMFAETHRFPFFMTSSSLDQCKFSRMLASDLDGRPSTAQIDGKVGVIATANDLRRFEQSLVGTPGIPCSNVDRSVLFNKPFAATGLACFQLWFAIERFRNCTNIVEAAALVRDIADRFIEDKSTTALPQSVKQVRVCDFHLMRSHIDLFRTAVFAHTTSCAELARGMRQTHHSLKLLQPLCPCFLGRHVDGATDSCV
jgi:hypothetical protein